MMSPEDEEEVLLQHFNNGTSPPVYVDSDSEDENVIYDKVPSSTTRRMDYKRYKLSRTARILKTVVLCLAFGCFGLCSALLGPTLLDLQERTGSDTQTITRIFIGRSVGSLLGCIIGGVVFDRVKNHSCLLAFSLFMAALFNAAAPWSREILLLISIMAVEGLFLGFLNTGGNAACMHIWGRKSAPYMQALHFCFGLGAFVAPLLSEPFLSDTVNHTVTELNATPTFGASPVALPLHLHRRDLTHVSPLSMNHSNISLPDLKAIPKPMKPTKTNGNLLSKDTNKAAGHNVKSDFVKKVIEKQKEVARKLNTPAPPTVKSSNQTVTVTTRTNTPTPTTTATITTVSTTTKTVATTTEATTTMVANGQLTTRPLSTGMNSSDDTYWVNITRALEKQLETVVYDISHRLTTIQFVYLIVSTIMLLVAMCFCGDGCYSCCRNHPVLTRRSQLRLVKNPGVGFNFQLISLLSLFFFLYAGIEDTYGGLVLSFVVHQAKWDKSWGTYVTSVFWGSFALTRGLCIVVSKYVKPGMLLIGDLVLTISGLLLLLLTVDHYYYTLWVGTALLGCGMASIIPSGFSWAESYINVTGKVSAAFVSASALGSILLPALCGFLMEKKSPMFLIYVLFATGLVCVVVYILMQNLAFNRGEKYHLFSRVRESDPGHEMETIALTAVTDDSSQGDSVVSRDHNGSLTTSNEHAQLNGHSNGKRVRFE